MQWHSAAEFFAMGGYAGYVWGSLGACALGMLIEPWLISRRHRRAVAEIRQERQAEAFDTPAVASAPATVTPITTRNRP